MALISGVSLSVVTPLLPLSSLGEKLLAHKRHHPGIRHLELRCQTCLPQAPAIHSLRRRSRLMLSLEFGLSCSQTLCCFSNLRCFPHKLALSTQSQKLLVAGSSHLSTPRRSMGPMCEVQSFIQHVPPPPPAGALTVCVCVRVHKGALVASTVGLEL